MFTVTKRYRDLPAAHRQPKHAGHCRLIHGHNWGFDFTFGCEKLDGNGFVVDLGQLEWLKRWLHETFDHTFLLNKEDQFLIMPEFAKIVRVPNCGVEGLAMFVFDKVQAVLRGPKAEDRGEHLIEVTCWEDSKNSATYHP